MGSKRRIIRTEDGLSLDATGYAGRYLLVDQMGEVQVATDTRDAICAFAAVLADHGGHAGQLSAFDGMTGKRYRNGVPGHVTVFLPYMIDAVFLDMPDDDKREMYRRTSAVLVAAEAPDGNALIDDMIVTDEIYQ